MGAVHALVCGCPWLRPCRWLGWWAGVNCMRLCTFVYVCMRVRVCACTCMIFIIVRDWSKDRKVI